MKKIIVAGLILLVLAGCSTGLSEADQQTFLQTAVAQTLEAQVTPTPTIDTSAIDELDYLTKQTELINESVAHVEAMSTYFGLWNPSDGYDYYAEKTVNECYAAASYFTMISVLTTPTRFKEIQSLSTLISNEHKAACSDFEFALKNSTAYSLSDSFDEAFVHFDKANSYIDKVTELLDSLD